MTLRWLRPALLVALSVALFAAAACDDGDETATPVNTPDLQRPPQQEVKPGMGENTLVQRTTDDLAVRLGVPPSDVNLVNFCYVTWPDGSIGVAEPGRVYTQAMVKGWLAILEAAAREYRYHGSETVFIAADFVPDATVLRDITCP